MKVASIVFALFMALPGRAGWQDHLGEKQFLYSPDYIDPYDYFTEDAESDRLTESIKVAFPESSEGKKNWDVAMISYRSVQRSKWKSLDPSPEEAKGLMERLGRPMEGTPIFETLLDQIGRPWRMYTWFFPKRQRLLCSMLPEAYVCFTKGPGSTLSEEAFYQKVLSEAYVQNPFWKWDALKVYVARSPSHPVLSDIELNQASKDQLSVRFKTLGKTFEFKGNPQKDMLRVMGALIPWKGKSSKWIAFGLQHYTPDLATVDCSIEISSEANLDLKDHFSALARGGTRPESLRVKPIPVPLKVWKFCSGSLNRAASIKTD